MAAEKLKRGIKIWCWSLSDWRSPADVMLGTESHDDTSAGVGLAELRAAASDGCSALRPTGAAILMKHHPRYLRDFLLNPLRHGFLFHQDLFADDHDLGFAEVLGGRDQ